MSVKMIMFFAGCFFIGNGLCLLLEGSGFGQQDVDILNALTGYNLLAISGSGLWAIPKLAVGFFIHGVPKLISWNYNFFDGGYVIFRVGLIGILSIGFVWGLIQTFMPFATGMLSKIRGG